MDFHVDRTLPVGDAVWVAGSNLAGRHGKGAALIARKQFGAIYGNSKGRQGMSYLIPTKDAQLAVLPLWVITGFVNDFLDYARAHPLTKFFVTRIGCELAGYTDADIAPLFRGAPDNCNFAESWRKYLE